MTRNPTRKNQDSYFILTDPDSRTIILGCLDGHGEFGDVVANFVAQEIKADLLRSKYFLSDLRKAILEAISYAETFLLHKFKGHVGFSGTTLTIVAIRDDDLMMINIGDSRSVLGGVDQSILCSSTDHKASIEEEKLRIEAAGGRVICKTYEDGFVGPARVYLAEKPLPGLAMSRSIGDTIVHDIGVISTPEVIERKLTAADRVLILATDGLWDFTTSEEAVLIATKSQSDGEEEGRGASMSSPKEVIERFCSQSVEKWNIHSPEVHDDTTIGVIFLKHGLVSQ